MKILYYEKYTKAGEPKIAQTDVYISSIMISDCRGIPMVEIIDGPKGIEIRQAEEGSFLKPTRLLHKEVR